MRAGPRARTRAPTSVALVLAALVIAPGCRAVGRGAQGFYEGSARLFTANPVAVGPFYVGLGLGLVAGSPLLLISWPLSALFGPSDESQWGLAARLAPALALGVVTGDLLALPLWPFGLPFEPDEPLGEPDEDALADDRRSD